MNQPSKAAMDAAQSIHHHLRQGGRIGVFLDADLPDIVAIIDQSCRTADVVEVLTAAESALTDLFNERGDYDSHIETRDSLRALLSTLAPATDD